MKNMKFRLWCFIMILPCLVIAQNNEQEPVKLINIGLEYGFQIPGGDFEDRFGTSSTLGTKIEYLTPNNISFAAQYSFFFGRNVKEDPILSLRDADSLFIGNNLSQANIFLRQRGFYVGASVGKLFPISQRNKKSGIKIDLGVGLLQHKIRIQDDPESFVPIVGGEYKKGYDRLTNGLSLRQFIGYQHHSLNRLINLYAGIELTQGFTQSRRSFDFDLGKADETKRFDFLTGIKVGWIVAIYAGDTGEDIYY